MHKLLFYTILYTLVFTGCSFSDLRNQVQLIKENIVNGNKSNLTSKSRQNIGTIVPLNSEIFSSQNVKKGSYGPYEDSNDVPFGLFFLKEYNPNKKIVLFIHGISGSPKEFEYLINHLDKTKFQALVAFYPSGFRLQEIGDYLNSLLMKLQNKLQFENISIVAHSMGGLVSRTIINNQIKSSNILVKQFISISTPWGGHRAANFGVKYTPIVIPVWRDMAQGSRFLRTLTDTQLPSSLKHYLLFSYKGKSMTSDGNSDGVISLKSQLRTDFQDNAFIVKGYNENHTSILRNKKLAIFINNILYK